MTTAAPTSTDVLVLDYLAELWAAGDDLPPEVRDELMTTVSGYIAMRRDLAGDPSQALTRLGPPEQLVAAVRRSGTPTHLRIPVRVTPATEVRARAGGSERAVVGLLTGGAFVLPGAAQAAAMLIASRSPAWSPTEKSAAWLLIVAPVIGLFLMMTMLTGIFLLSGLSLLMFYLASTAGSLAAGLTLRRGL